jgi:hypothetical protein
LTKDADSVVDSLDFPANASPTYSNVACHFEKRREGSAPGTIGRIDQDILDTTDRLHLSADQEIGDSWAVKITSGAYNGLWFITVGDDQILEWRDANDKTILLKPSLRQIGT